MVAVGPADTSVWRGSFFQPDLVANWTATNFATEFGYMANVKMDHAIWQWTADSTPTKMWTYYPTTMSGFTQHNATDAVGLSLAQAQAKDLKIWLGLNWNDDWWSKGGNDNTWLMNQFAISNQVAQELWNRHGGQYGGTIAGFYMPMEVDNVTFSASGAQTNIIGVYRDTAAYIHNATGKPVMVSPFFVENAAGGLNQTDYAWAGL